MALLHADSVQFYNPTTDGAGFYTTASMSPAVGRIPVPSGSTASGFSGGSTLTFKTEVETACVGAAWKTNLLYLNPFGFQNNFSGFQFQVLGVGDGRFFVGATLGGTENMSDCSTKSISANLWYHMQLYLETTPGHQPFVPATTGSPAIPEYWWVNCTYQFLVNGETWLSGTIQSGNRFGNGTWTTHLNVGGVTLAAAAGVMTDVWITDGDVLGDNAIKVLYPAGDSATDFTPKIGTTHYTMVNEHTASGTDYNQATAASQEDSYTLDSLPAFTGTISGTSAVWYLENTDGGSSSVSGWYNVNTTSTPLFYPNTGYRFFEDCEELNPNTGLGWTQPDINSLTLGITRAS